MSARALGCCRHCTRLPQEHATIGTAPDYLKNMLRNRHCTRLPQEHATIGTAPDYLNNMLQSALHQITSTTCYNRHCTRLPQEHATIGTAPDYLKNMLQSVSKHASQWHSDQPRTTTWPCHALGSSSANIRSASPPREHETVILPICTSH